MKTSQEIDKKSRRSLQQGIILRLSLDQFFNGTINLMNRLGETSLIRLSYRMAANSMQKV